MLYKLCALHCVYFSLLQRVRKRIEADCYGAVRGYDESKFGSFLGAFTFISTEAISFLCSNIFFDYAHIERCSELDTLIHFFQFHWLNRICFLSATSIRSFPFEVESELCVCPAQMECKNHCDSCCKKVVALRNPMESVL